MEGKEAAAVLGTPSPAPPELPPLPATGGSTQGESSASNIRHVLLLGCFYSTTQTWGGGTQGYCQHPDPNIIPHLLGHPRVHPGVHPARSPGPHAQRSASPKTQRAKGGQPAAGSHPPTWKWGPQGRLSTGRGAKPSSQGFSGLSMQGDGISRTSTGDKALPMVGFTQGKLHETREAGARPSSTIPRAQPVPEGHQQLSKWPPKTTSYFSLPQALVSNSGRAQSHGAAHLFASANCCLRPRPTRPSHPAHLQMPRQRRSRCSSCVGPSHWPIPSKLSYDATS